MKSVELGEEKSESMVTACGHGMLSSSGMRILSVGEWVNSCH
jgi:hypothetical protein